ncbi:MAG: F0F1 ATP synthase subunit delta [Patescibacteria group bacterium]
MTNASNNDIAYAIYLSLKNKEDSGQVGVMRNIATFLSKKRLLNKSEKILASLKKIINKEEGRILVKVSSVEKISPNTKKELDDFLKKRYKAREIIFQEVINKEVLGGIRLEIENEVIDLSVKNRIDKLQEYLIRK